MTVDTRRRSVSRLLNNNNGLGRLRESHSERASKNAPSSIERLSGIGAARRSHRSDIRTKISMYK